MNSKLSQSILKKIQQEKIKPVPKYYFILKNISFWILFLFMFVFGFISFSVILFSINNTEFDLFDSLSETSGIAHFFNLLPLLWILFIGIFLGIAIWGLKHTKRGYKIAISFLFFGNILGSMILGSLVYGFGGAEKIENILDENVNIYESVRKKHQKFWANPEASGRLAGIIQEINFEENYLELQDLKGKKWKVSFSKINKRTKNLLRKISKNNFQENNQKNTSKNISIKLKGKISKNNIFEAERIRPAFRMKKIHERRKKFFEKPPELRKKIRLKLKNN